MPSVLTQEQIVEIIASVCQNPCVLGHEVEAVQRVKLPYKNSSKHFPKKIFYDKIGLLETSYTLQDS